MHGDYITMIDFLKMAVFFKPDFCTTSAPDRFGLSVSYVSLEECSRRGARLEAREVEFFIDGDLEVQGLRHPYESLPSSFTGIAIKIRQGSKFRPDAHVEIKASPAKVLQGHNVYGSEDISLCAMELLTWLAHSLPELGDMLDWESTEVDWIDCTYSARASSDWESRQFIQALKHVKHGQLKADDEVENGYSTTAYFNKNSTYHPLKIYLKGEELKNQLKGLEAAKKREGSTRYDRLINSMQSGELAEFATGLIRFEARAKSRYLKSLGLPKALFTRVSNGRTFEGLIDYAERYEKENGKSLIRMLWEKMFEPVMSAIEGEAMDIYSDEKVHTMLRDSYYRITPKGNITYSKADKIFGFYRRLVNEGYQEVYSTMPRNTFSRQLNDLMSGTGYAKSHLQNLSGKNANVIPMIRVACVDFDRQRPDGYVEPKSWFADDNVVGIFSAVA